MADRQQPFAHLAPPAGGSSGGISGASNSGGIAGASSSGGLAGASFDKSPSRSPRPDSAPHSPVRHSEDFSAYWKGKKYQDSWLRLTDEEKRRKIEKQIALEEQERHEAFKRGEVEWQGRKYDESWKRLTEDLRYQFHADEEPQRIVYPREEVEWRGRRFHDSWVRLTQKQEAKQRQPRELYHKYPRLSWEFHGRKHHDSWKRLTREDRPTSAPSAAVKRPTKLEKRIDEMHKQNLLLSSKHKRDGLQSRFRTLETELEKLGAQGDHARALLRDLGCFIGL